MSVRPYWPLVLAVVGVVLLLNPVYLYPNGVPAEQTYTLRAEQVDDLQGALLHSATGDRIVRCASGAGPHENRVCVFESLVGPNGSVQAPNRTVSDGNSDRESLRYPYDYVYFDSEEGFYEPRVAVENESITLSLDPVPARSVAENMSATPYGGALDSVQRAIETGNETATVRLSPDSPFGNDRTDELDQYVGSPGTLVVKDDTYYLVSAGVSFRQHSFPPLLLDAIRLVGTVAGLFLLYRSILRQQALGDSAW